MKIWQPPFSSIITDTIFSDAGCALFTCAGVYTVFLRPGIHLKNMNGLLTRLWSTFSKGLFALLVFLQSAARVVRHTEVFLQIQQHSHKSKVPCIVSWILVVNHCSHWQALFWKIRVQIQRGIRAVGPLVVRH